MSKVMATPPCKGCTKRFVNTETLETCRTSCEAWQEWERRKAERYAKEKIEREAENRILEHYAELRKRKKLR